MATKFICVCGFINQEGSAFRYHNQMPDALSLPDDVLRNIAGRLSLEEWCKAARTCKALWGLQLLKAVNTPGLTRAGTGKSLPMHSPSVVKGVDTSSVVGRIQV